MNPVSSARVLQVAACVMAAGCASAPAVPPALHVPPSQRLIAQLHAKGVQIYQCQPAKSDPSRWEWSFKQPEAALFKGHRGAGKHYAGPTWEANDGSKVIGEVVNRSESPKPDSIPWLLLRAKSTTGAGLFSGVQYVQRVNTAGGNAPTAACREEQAAQQLRAAYEADYLFYGVKP